MESRLAVGTVHMTETFIGKQKVERLTQGAYDGHALLLSKGKYAGLPVQKRIHAKLSGHFQDSLIRMVGTYLVFQPDILQGSKLVEQFKPLKYE
jgi:hypothetical protein